jgi:hypothetical protein
MERAKPDSDPSEERPTKIEKLAVFALECGAIYFTDRKLASLIRPSLGEEVDSVLLFHQTLAHKRTARICNCGKQ